MGTYHLQKHGPNAYFFSLRGGNGERILQSEMYTTKGAAFGGISTCKVNSPLDERYLRLDAKNGQPYFVLRAANNEVIGASETYSSREAREVGITSCKKNGPDSGTVDETGER